MMDLFSVTANCDKKTMLKLIRESHYRGWLHVRDDLIDQVKFKLTDSELKEVLEMVEASN